MTDSRKLLILGFGGHARSVADVALACGYVELVFVDEHARDGENFLGHPVFTEIAPYIDQDWVVFPAAGDNQKREKQLRNVLDLGFSVATLVSPKASIGAGANLSAGCFVGHHAHIGPMARVGIGCIINTSAVVEHEAILGDFCHVSVNAVMAGRTRIGSKVMLGAGATVLDGLSIADGVIIGGGGLVHRSISEIGVYVGVPVRPVGHLEL